jgi:hypothetical protein
MMPWAMRASRLASERASGVSEARARERAQRTTSYEREPTIPQAQADERREVSHPRLVSSG